MAIDIDTLKVGDTVIYKWDGKPYNITHIELGDFNNKYLLIDRPTDDVFNYTVIDILEDIEPN